MANCLSRCFKSIDSDDVILCSPLNLIMQPSSQEIEPTHPLSLAVESLKLEIEQLKAENSDLEILLENRTEHSTDIETELH